MNTLLKKLRAVTEFEDTAEIMSTFADLGHREESDSILQRMSHHSWKSCGNPFLKESGPDRITLDTKEGGYECGICKGFFSMLLRKKNNCIIPMLQTI